MKLFRSIALLVFCLVPIEGVTEESPCGFSEEALVVASRIRELPIKRTVECRALNPEAFRSLAREIVDRDLGHHNLTHEGSFLKFLGVLPQSYNYPACVGDGYATAAAAFYSPYLGYFVVPDWAPPSKAVLVHEATHALQDQHFDTRRFAYGRPLLSDESLAAGSLLEGDAMSVEEEYVRSVGGRDNAPGPDLTSQLATKSAECELPPVFGELFHGMYDYGYHFVSELRASGGWGAVNSAFLRTPTTTEEVLRAKRFLAGERNKKVGVPHTIQKGAKLLFASEVGELVMRVLFKHSLDPRRAVLAAAGGAGDMAALYKLPGVSGKELFIWESRWERERDVDEFWSVALEVWGRRGGGAFNAASRSVHFIDSSGLEMKFSRNKNLVRIELER